MSAARGLTVVSAQVPFAARPGLREVDLSVDQGERVALVGPSGVGKTSLLRAIAGLQPMASGAVIVDGSDVTNLPPERRGIVYMHQTPSLFSHLSVIDNVGFPLELRGTPRKKARTRAAELLERVQLASLAQRAPHTLSGGQRHRVALARALAATPAVLLLDEPFSALDPELRTDVRHAVIDLLDSYESAPAVLVVTHDVDEAAALAHRIAVLLNGRLVQIASPDTLFSAPASAGTARFLGLPNVLSGNRSVDGIVAFALGRVVRPGPSGPVTVVVRVNAVRVLPRQHGTAARVVGVQHKVSGTLVSVTLGGHNIVGVPEPGLAAAIGDVVDLDVDMTAVHVIAAVHEDGGV